ncbi:hypothetical protein F4604DRAFT_1149793 [Suillus subluteus]|nr:hypothetical protein F4604DRAFT_1149793 [Suillus subluteus]
MLCLEQITRSQQRTVTVMMCLTIAGAAALHLDVCVIDNRTGHLVHQHLRTYWTAYYAFVHYVGKERDKHATNRSLMCIEDAMSFFETGPSRIIFQEHLTPFIEKCVHSGAVC